MSQCMAQNANGQRCRSRGSVVVGEWLSCKRPEHAAAEQVDAPDEEPRSPARQLIGEAMDHAMWESVPREIQQLIEHAWVQSEREGWDEQLSTATRAPGWTP